MAVEFCPRCDASLRAGARFCGHCGAETDHGVKEFRRARLERKSEMKRRATAVFWSFFGPILAMMILVTQVEDMGEAMLYYYLSCVAICLLVLQVLGPGTWRHSLGRRLDGKGALLGLATPLISLPVAIGYVSLLPRPEVEASDLLELVRRLAPWLLLLHFCVAPALLEEWLCRGTCWVALRPVCGGRMTILVTASLFAILHGLNGGLTLELPHRFVMGLLLGWLRARTGSIWPCVLAHFAHNAAAIFLLD